MTTALAVAGMLALAACPPPPPRDVPARITKPTAESHAELERVVRGALKGAPVTIAGDALARDSMLIIERAPARDAAGVPLTGRDRGRPERFRLVTNGARCALVHERSGRRWTLASASCSPE